MGDDPAIGAHQRNAYHQRKREPHPLVQPRIAPIEQNAVARAHPPGEDYVKQKRPKKCTGQRADG